MIILHDASHVRSKYLSRSTTKYLLHCLVREAHMNWSMVISEKATPVTAATWRTTDPVPAGPRL